MKYRILPIAAYLILNSIVFTAHLTAADDDFDSWKKEELGRFNDFRDERDRGFTIYLKEQWEEFRAFAGEKAYEKPKPVKIPEISEKKLGPQKPLPGQLIKVPPPLITPEETPAEPPIARKEVPLLEPPAGEEILEFSFFGSNVKLRYDPAIRASEVKKPSEKTISLFWEEASKSDYEGFLQQARYYKDKFLLNDWGYERLLRRAAKTLYGDSDKNGGELFTWFLLIKSGYDAKVAYSGGHVYTLLPSENRLYGTTYVMVGEKRYYALSLETGEWREGLYTYKGTYPGSRKSMDFSILRIPEVAREVRTKTLSFRYGGHEYLVPLVFNRGVPAFFRDYPQTEFEIYFKASVSSEATDSLVKAFKPIIEGKSEGEAVNMIMRFVQTAFSYKTDDEQFGKEKYMLPDETFFYPYSDCEDRSILFAYMVKKLTGLKVVGLHYPGHMAAAVRFNTHLEGDSILYSGERYIVCDPTFVNAHIGMTMPGFKKFKPHIIPV